MFKHGFTTIGENLVNLVGIGAVVLVVLMIGNTDIVALLKWLFAWGAVAFLVALTLILATVYGVAEVFSRRNYTPLTHRNMTYRVDGQQQQLPAEPAAYFQPSQGDHRMIEGVAETIAEWDDPADIR